MIWKNAAFLPIFLPSFSSPRKRLCSIGFAAHDSAFIHHFSIALRFQQSTRYCVMYHFWLHFFTIFCISYLFFFHRDEPLTPLFFPPILSCFHLAFVCHINGTKVFRPAQERRHFLFINRSYLCLHWSSRVDKLCFFPLLPFALAFCFLCF